MNQKQKQSRPNLRRRGKKTKCSTIFSDSEIKLKSKNPKKISNLTSKISTTKKLDLPLIELSKKHLKIQPSKNSQKRQ